MESARKWIAEIEMTKGNYRFSPALETRIIVGSFADVFERCCRAAEGFRYHQPISMGISPTTKVKLIDPQGGHIECSLGGSWAYLIHRWSLRIFVQKNGVQHRGIVIICTYSRVVLFASGTSDIVKQMWEALAQTGLRFTS